MTLTMLRPLRAAALAGATSAAVLLPAMPAADAAPAAVAVPAARSAGAAADAGAREFPRPSQLRGYRKAARWARLPKVRYIRFRESRNTYRINTGNGYYGAYQFAYGTWVAMGGQRYAPTANLAPKHIQDYVAWRLFKRAGWAPWGG